jgi:predicted RNase H-like nuclease (RuvC/YqgF family)
MRGVRGLARLILCSMLAASAYGQSLGDVARQTRQKQSSKGDAAKKVITNEDIPESPDANADEPEPARASGKPSRHTPQLRPQSVEQVKSGILEQKHQIVSLQDEIDKLNGSIYFWDANLFSSSSAAARHNQLQMKKQQQIEYLRTQLAEQQKKLVEMQHAAMESGMGSTVYDP